MELHPVRRLHAVKGMASPVHHPVHQPPKIPVPQNLERGGRSATGGGKLSAAWHAMGKVLFCEEGLLRQDLSGRVAVVTGAAG